MKKTAILFLIICALGMNAQTQQDDNTFDNSKVIELTKAHISKPIIIQSIEEASNYNYDISVKGLKQLSQSKIDEDVVILLMKKQNEKKNKSSKVDNITIDKDDYGLFVSDNNQKFKIPSHQTQANFKGKMMGFDLKATIPDSTSGIIISPINKVFYFNMGEDDKGASNSFFNAVKPFSDPNEGVLIKLKTNRNNRELDLGKVRAMAGMKTEIPEKYKIKYRVEKVSGNVYKIMIEANLHEGEYGFIFGAINPGGVMRIYDFTVK
ncbi:hypothetical protein HZP31_15565 [Elizabethkingia anophelis]|uniref:hypothetical protein n=2 Tax=Weeksellaceae TaxID=2762318 RepID=UPI0020B253F9|nr:hypothetical protein [Elizabethkingia anophelis]MCT3756762.1 hypothetical protein [Elizabethkingia anophelis]MCT4145330.1 hypothetical protein [Elizabethkingia anophelis]MCT4267146.1 hypothetical protein [Elizabethkingia anophelis]MCT4270700.1 hypothetical protein [Elizabethkingia anophelis]UTF97954.1 hypothetical protein J2N94_06720 [Elizabethkingia anophelis]